ADPEIHPAIEATAERLAEGLAEVVAVAAFDLVEGQPEGPLSNLTADAMLAEAERLTGEEFDLAVGNNGGLRIALAAGPVTLREVYELMPFENFLVAQTLSGVQVDSLAQQLARVGGEPVAGLRFAITPAGEAVEVEVAGEPLDPSATYRVVTHNYLAYGGGDMPALWEPLDLTELPMTLREAFVNHFRRLGTLAPRADGRVRVLEGQP
ncbi:MAG: 5'-nucleotidase C-terminal domain-containing protein, partial [Rhodothermales bacterium]|nr:5'-nucleotidase C-terminal domain-containing protein [Rhodothermales bacterium]